MALLTSHLAKLIEVQINELRYHEERIEPILRAVPNKFARFLLRALGHHGTK